MAEQILMFSWKLSGKIFLAFWQKFLTCSPNDFFDRNYLGFIFYLLHHTAKFALQHFLMLLE